jgi:hypothetical protein
MARVDVRRRFLCCDANGYRRKANEVEREVIANSGAWFLWKKYFLKETTLKKYFWLKMGG